MITYVALDPVREAKREIWSCKNVQMKYGHSTVIISPELLKNINLFQVQNKGKANTHGYKKYLVFRSRDSNPGFLRERQV